MLKTFIEFLVIGFIVIMLVAFGFVDAIYEYCKKHVDCVEGAESEDD